MISIVVAAALNTAKSGRITQARLCVGSCSAVAQRLPALEAALTGLSTADLAQPLDLPPDAFAPLTPITDMRGDAPYRMGAARTLVLRRAAAALEKA